VITQNKFHLWNRRLASGTLFADFQKPFSALAETNEGTRSVQNIFERDLLWWSLYDKVITFFEQNPD
jgi:hypothetical protein